MYAPGRWDTSDGCVPWRIVWAYWDATQMIRSRGVMDTAQAIGLAFSGEEGERARLETRESAFPDEAAHG